MVDEKLPHSSIPHSTTCSCWHCMCRWMGEIHVVLSHVPCLCSYTVPLHLSALQLRLYQKHTNSMSGIEELYAIVNQVAKEQEATQKPSSQYSEPGPVINGKNAQIHCTSYLGPVWCGSATINVGWPILILVTYSHCTEAANVYDTLESALKQKEQLEMKKEVTAAMKKTTGSGVPPETSPQKTHPVHTQSALGALGGAGAAVSRMPHVLSLSHTHTHTHTHTRTHTHSHSH